MDKYLGNGRPPPFGARGQKGINKSYSLNANPFVFLIAVEVLLRTLAKAGTYYVDDPQVLNIERPLIEEHLAQCRVFALEWSTKAHLPGNTAITHQLARIYLTIRTKWVTLYRENRPDNITFTRCIKQTTPAADMLWNADLTREVEYAPKGNGKGESKQLAEVRNVLANLKKEKGAGKDRPRKAVEKPAKVQPKVQDCPEVGE